MFREYELLLETDENGGRDGGNDTDDDKQTEPQLAENVVGSMQDVPDAEFAQFAPTQQEDVAFGKFKSTIESEPDQVLRYDRGGAVLWISGKNCLDTNDVNNCEYCNGPRVFEFQVRSI